MFGLKVAIFDLDKVVESNIRDPIYVNNILVPVGIYQDIDYDPWVSIQRAKQGLDYAEAYTLDPLTACKFIAVVQEVFPDNTKIDEIPMYISRPSDVHKICSRLCFYVDQAMQQNPISILTDEELVDGDDTISEYDATRGEFAKLIDFARRFIGGIKSGEHTCDKYALVLLPMV